MSVSAEFIVNLGPYEHVKLTLSDQDLIQIQRHQGSELPFEEWLGDYHASLKAAVLYGRDRALGEIAEADADQARDRELGITSETALEGAVEALTEGLGATVLSEEEKPQETPSSSSSRPWKNKPATRKQQPWEEPVPQAQDGISEMIGDAATAATPAAASDGWDF